MVPAYISKAGHKLRGRSVCSPLGAKNPKKSKKIKIFFGIFFSLLNS